MNKRQIILDFTSLLDVIMIILFFFILFARLETDDAKAALAEQQAQLQEGQAQLKEGQAQLQNQAELLQGQKEQYESLIQQAEDYLNELQDSGNAAAVNVAGIHDFSQGSNIKIKLNMNNGNWKLDIFSVKKKIGEISNDTTENMVKSLSDILSSAGYTEDSTILCEFFYNGTDPGTSTAQPIAKEVFKNTRFKFTNFKVSETDTSIFGEDK